MLYRIAQAESYQFSTESHDLVYEYLNSTLKSKHSSFGNGRFVRNLFEMIKNKYAERVINQNKINAESQLFLTAIYHLTLRYPQIRNSYFKMTSNQ